MSDKRTAFEKFRDLAQAVVRVPKGAVQQSAARPTVTKRKTKRPKA